MRSGQHLPRLRRYARAAAGSAAVGDAALAACLPGLAALPPGTDPARLLATLITQLDETPLRAFRPSGTLGDAIARLPRLPRHALLLTTLEGMTEIEAAALLGETPAAITRANGIARDALRAFRPARVLIIGDDGGGVARVVRELGHSICAKVANEDAAWQAVRRTRPDLVVVEETLADGGSGVEAVARIAANDAVPVVLIGSDELQGHGYPLVRQPWRDTALREAIGRALRGRDGTAG